MGWNSSQYTEYRLYDTKFIKEKLATIKKKTTGRSISRYLRREKDSEFFAFDRAKKLTIWRGIEKMILVTS